jgi:sugar lactone lactonase YvrE
MAASSRRRSGILGCDPEGGHKPSMKTRWRVANGSLTLAAVFLLISSAPAQTVTIAVGGFVGDGGSARKAGLEAPSYVAEDKAGNLYISDNSGQRIRRVTPAGTISTYAGTGVAGFDGDGGPATSAMLSYPAGLTFDAHGDLIIADGGNNRIRKIDATGTITTIAGTGVAGYTGDGGHAIKATFNQPWYVAYDTRGNLYVTELGNCVVRVVNTAGIIHTYAGNGACGFGGDGGKATAANLNLPRSLAFDPVGNLYIADAANHRVRKVAGSGKITTFAGNGNAGFSGDGGAAIRADIGNPHGLAFRNGQLYISNAGRSRVRTVSVKTGVINTYAGSLPGYDGGGTALLSSFFFAPAGLLFNSAGDLLVVDSGNQRVRALVGDTTETVAGGWIGDHGPAVDASLTLPEAVAFDKHGNYYIADTLGNRIRKVNALGKITTMAGTGVSGYSGDASNATVAQLWFPLGVAVDSRGDVFIADDFNGVIRKVDTSGIITTFTTNPNFTGLGVMAMDSFDNLYVVDQSTCVVWQISPTGVTNVVAGITFGCGYSGDGGPATLAELNTPIGVAVDGAGNIFVADSGNNRVREFQVGGNINTIAGNGICGFAGDNGPAIFGELCFPAGVAVSSRGTIYIADEFNLRVRKVDLGTITTYAGTGVAGYNGDDLPALSTNFDDPVAVTLSPWGSLFLVDDATMRVRQIQ